MHGANRLFWEHCRSKYRRYFDGAREVAEFGSYDINGTVRDYFTGSGRYVGIDWRPGKGVDVVSLAHSFQTTERFQTVISASMLEHDPYWAASVEKMVSVLADDGILLLSWGAAKNKKHCLPEAPDGGFHSLKAGMVLRLLERLGMYINEFRYEGRFAKEGLLGDGMGEVCLVAFKSQQYAEGDRVVDDLIEEDRCGEIEIPFVSSVENDRILVLMCYYDRPNMVRNALSSLARQDYTNWEMVFADDGSGEPVENIVKEVLGTSFQKCRYVHIGDTVEEKQRRGGSVFGKVWNESLCGSCAGLAIMLCDDDVLVPGYLGRLAEWYQKNPEAKWSYCHVVLFDPFAEQDFTTTNGKRKSQSSQSVNTVSRPAGFLDASQVSWRTSCNKVGEIWFPHPQTRNLDETFFEKMSSVYGACPFNGMVGQFKGWCDDSLILRSPEQTYRVRDIAWK